MFVDQPSLSGWDVLREQTGVFGVRMWKRTLNGKIVGHYIGYEYAAADPPGAGDRKRRCARSENRVRALLILCVV